MLLSAFPFVYAGATRVGGVPWYDATDAMLFFDDKWLAESSSLETKCGNAFLLPGAYVDPTTYIGWGYPSVFPLPGGGFRAIFEVGSNYNVTISIYNCIFTL